MRSQQTTTTLRACVNVAKTEVRGAKNKVSYLEQQISELQDNLLDAECDLGDLVKKLRDYKNEYRELSDSEDATRALYDKLLKDPKFNKLWIKEEKYNKRDNDVDLMGYVPKYEGLNCSPLCVVSYHGGDGYSGCDWVHGATVVKPSKWMPMSVYNKYVEENYK